VVVCRVRRLLLQEFTRQPHQGAAAAGSSTRRINFALQEQFHRDLGRLADNILLRITRRLTNISISA
jgi:hypothetical protein